MPRIEKNRILDAPVEKVYEILNDYNSLPIWNIVVNEVTEMEPKKYFLKTNVGEITNTEIENIPQIKMTSTQEGSPMEKIGYIFESKGKKTEVTIWTEFELENQKSVLDIAADLFMKSLVVYVDFIMAGGSPEDYQKNFEKIKNAY
ncbi:MAG: SRPBCC family protein [Promethearchaeota archaeon]|nr:MAG: SRPBCC family protein [Candidatus Lokiarchaeota archaeon]